RLARGLHRHLRRPSHGHVLFTGCLWTMPRRHRGPGLRQQDLSRLFFGVPGNGFGMNSTNSQTPVITIDGPTASGKGTIAHRVAQVLGWSVLDSGALYRLSALACLDRGVDTADEAAVAAVAREL